MLPQLLLSALFTATALSVAVPAPVPDVHALAASRGIDVSGPIPSDATRTTDGYNFAADSNAAIWVRAQLTPSSGSIEKRQLANIGIGMFAGQNCLGEGSWIDNVSYGSQVSRSVQFMSVGISYRGLASGEHLDFSKSTSSNLNLCGTYVYSAAPFTGIGCFNSQPINCFRLWR